MREESYFRCLALGRYGKLNPCPPRGEPQMAKVDEHMKMSKRRWIGAALVGLAFLTSWLLLSLDIFPRTKVSSQFVSPADGNVYSAVGL